MSTSYRHKRIPRSIKAIPTEIRNGRKYYGYEGCFSEEELTIFDEMEWEIEDKKIEICDMFKEDELEQRKIREKEEYCKNTFRCPAMYYHPTTQEPRFNTREEYETAYNNKYIYVLWSNETIHAHWDEIEAMKKKYREETKWRNEMDKEIDRLMDY
jgi:hypothetical protein